MINIGKNVTIGRNVVINKNDKDNLGKVGFTCGSFDLMHPGHILMFKEAKEQCDHLIVGVQSDPTIDRKDKNKPIQGYEERLIMVTSIKYIDEVMLYDSEADLLNLLKKINPNVRIIGSDWRGKKFTGSELDIDVYFNAREHSWSSSDLRYRVFESEKNRQFHESNKLLMTIHPLNDCPASGF